MEEQPKNKQEKLKFFHDEMNKFRELEKINGEGHFKQCNPFKLKEEDQEIYEKFKLGILTLEEFNEYRDRTMRVGNPDQQEFSAFIANKLTTQMFRKNK